MSERHSPGVRRRRLSAALRRLRADSGMSAVEVAERLRWSPAKVTRIERNEWKRPNYRDVEDLADLYNVSREQREHLIGLTEESRERGFWREYQDVFVGPLPEFEAEATRIRTYEGLVVPGLLQTPDYSAEVFRGGRVVHPEEIERRVEARMARRRVLDDPSGPHLWAIIDEAALLKIAGSPETTRGQLHFLMEMAEHPRVTIQVVGNEAGTHAAVFGAFSLIDFPRPEPSVVYLPTAVEPLYIEDQTYVDRYTLIYDHVHGSALSPVDSVARIQHIIERLPE
ncbi:helix-turn-helix domain-containing protein [Marinactinospora thermotolerans]|uniref:helix-turn-helix domain-containing protein n=1 Tax=Marinactinospora thermotolerans TaxID=531310 RepID=UPI003D8F9ECB